MDSNWILSLVVLLGLILFLGWAIFRKKALPPAKPQEPVAPPAPDLQPEKVELKEPARPAFKISKAISAWIPLLKEKSRDKDRWEEALILSDMGPQLTKELLGQLSQDQRDPESFLKTELKKILQPAETRQDPWNAQKPWVLFLVGVNGAGKTTTIVKIAEFLRDQGKSVGVIGADTFRKAAIEQLETWCARAGFEFFTKRKSEHEAEGADPSAVIFDGLKSFEKMDAILVDTSGRLHTKQNLMEELKKMKRVASKAIADTPHDIWLVLDATLGQNALHQAKVFHESVELTGLVLTKLDGLSKGGAVFNLFRNLQKPIWFLAYGEGLKDLKPFNSDQFVEELFDQKAS